MLKTNSKIVKERIQAHVIDCLSEDYTEVLAEQLQNVINEFKNWYCPYEQKRTPNKQKAFIDFLLGLPSCLSIEFSYYNIRQILMKWLEQTEVESDKYEDDKTSQLYYSLVFREFSTLCNKNNIKF